MNYAVKALRCSVLNFKCAANTTQHWSRVWGSKTRRNRRRFKRSKLSHCLEYGFPNDAIVTFCRLFDWRPEKMRGERSKNERTVIIKNLFEPELFDREVHLILDYQNDLREECNKCGTVRKVIIYDVSHCFYLICTRGCVSFSLWHTHLNCDLLTMKN